MPQRFNSKTKFISNNVVVRFIWELCSKNVKVNILPDDVESGSRTSDFENNIVFQNLIHKAA